MAGAKAHCMAVARDPVTGAALLSATINVYNPGTVTPIAATIFDKSGGTLSNPLTSDATTGLIDFYLSVAQEVDLVVSKASYTTRTYSNVPVIDDASFDLTALLTTTGDIAYASSANTPVRLGIGSTGAFLTVTGGVPAWSNTIAAGGLQVTAGNVGIGVAPDSTASLKIANSILVPQAAGAQIFSIDAAATGQSIGNNGTATPYGNTNCFSGLVIVTNVTDGGTALFVCGATVVQVGSASSGTWSATQGTTTSNNVYQAAGVLTIENKTGGTKEYRVLGLRTRVQM